MREETRVAGGRSRGVGIAKTVGGQTVTRDPDTRLELQDSMFALLGFDLALV